MKLWVLRPVDGLNDKNNPWKPWYDKTFGFVIRAETEDDARELAHNNAGDENHNYSPWKDANYSTCTELLPEGEETIIIMDFCSA